jgi:hypothetical protein
MKSQIQYFFEEVYKRKGWGDNNSPYYSGPGSHSLNIINPYIEVLKAFFKTFNKKPNIIDIGCGDFNIGKNLLDSVNNYLAIDVVDPLIQYNKIKYKNSNLKFKTLDITKSTIPFSDVVIVKEVFQHLSNDLILKSLKNLYLKSKFLIITESLPIIPFTPNLDINLGVATRPLINNSGVDIISPPFNFSIEEELITLKIKTKGIKECFIKTSIYKQKSNN